MRARRLPCSPFSIALQTESRRPQRLIGNRGHSPISGASTLSSASFNGIWVANTATIGNAATDLRWGVQASTAAASFFSGDQVDRAAVARRLHMSERTLQRQLEQESTTFKVLRDGVRSELSRALLANRALKVEAIAQSVGFAEAASFSKAFARWSGHPPTHYREQLERRRATS